MFQRSILLAAMVACMVAPAFAADALRADAPAVTFTAGPKVVKAGDQWQISFALSTATDVEVAIVGPDGKVARHLAAGVLNAAGKNPPPDPLKAGLAQELTWDGTDDLGRKIGTGTVSEKELGNGASPHSFKLQVRAGMGVKFGKIIGTSPYTGSVSMGAPYDSIATDTDGTLYIKMGSFVPQLHEGIPWQLRKFDKTGKYVKTLLPYPPSTPPAKASGIRLVDTGDSAFTPANTNPLDPTLFMFGDNIHNRIVNGSVVFIDNRTAKLMFFKLDGSNELKTVPMRSAPDKLKWPNWLSPQIAFSPDGKYAYYSNVANTPYDGKTPADMDPKFPQGRIYRQDLSAAGADPEPFYDLELPDWQTTKYWMPSAWDKRTAAAGVAVDPKGNLFVCDLVNQEVVEVSPAGKKLSATKVAWPDKVLVAGKTGTLYVVSRQVSRGAVPPATLIKITGRGAEAKEAARLPLKGSLGHSLAVDESGPSPVLWLGGGEQVVRIEDRGAELAPAVPGILNPDKNAIGFVCFGEVDREAEMVYVTEGMGRVWRYNGETGEGGLAPILACDVAVGPGGMIYGWGNDGKWEGPVARYTRDFKPAPLAATGKNTYGRVFGRYGRGNNAPGMAVDNRGWVYAICGFNDCHMRVYDADGKLVQYERTAKVGEGKSAGVPAFLSYVLDQGGSVRVDSAHNVYVLEIGLPKGFVPPKGFEKDPAYTRCSGTIYKFTPKGGEFKKTADGWDAIGSVAKFAGCAPISGSWNSTGSVCHCTRPRFDVDEFGRLFIPNAVTYDVSVRDNADNEIVRFGHYGNFDAAGPGSAEPKPEIPLGWPIFAGATDQHIYVGDCLNHRVVRADKTWAAQAACEVK